MRHPTFGHPRIFRKRFAPLLLAIGLAPTGLPATTLAAPISFENPSPVSTSSSVAPLWYQDTTSSDPIQALVDVFAYEADTLSFYVDQLASEQYLGSACDQPC